MSSMSERALAEEAEYYSAVKFLCDLGVLEECEYHQGTYFNGNEDLNHAYQIANSRITSGAISLGNNQTRRQFTDRLKAAYEDNSGIDACQECAKHFESET